MNASLSFSVAVEGNTATIQGMLEKGDGQRFIKAVTGKNIQSLTVNSGGGDVESGLEIGTYVFQHQLPVHITGMCGSSCANYIAAASPKVTVQSGGVILLHGGISESHEQNIKWLNENIPPDKLSEALAYTQRIEKTEDAFFQLVGSDPDILYLSRIFVEKNKIQAWAPTQQELNCYGYRIITYQIPQSTRNFMTTKDALFPPAIKCKT